MTKRVKVMAFGGFDVLHAGHVHFLQYAKRQGDYLIVVVATDRVLKKVKRHDPYFSQEERRRLVGSLKFVDKAILGDKNNTLLPIKWERPDVIVLGYDQPKQIGDLRKELAAIGIRVKKIVRAKPFAAHKHKSSKVKKYFEQYI